jgi:hypothetical protein
MTVKFEKDKLVLTPENRAEESYLERDLCLTHDGASVQLRRVCDDNDPECWGHLEAE